MGRREFKASREGRIHFTDQTDPVVPGFYVERAIHIHAEVHIDWSVTSSGTISSSNRVSTDQLYLNETVSQQLMALEPYASHTQINRTTNDIDSTYAQSANGTGYNPVIDIVAADGVNIANGVIGISLVELIPRIFRLEALVERRSRWCKHEQVRVTHFSPDRIAFRSSLAKRGLFIFNLNPKHLGAILRSTLFCRLRTLWGLVFGWRLE